MKMRLLASFLLIFSLSSMAMADAALVDAEAGITLRDPVTQKMNRLSAKELADPDTVMAYVAPVDGANDLYKAYVANGYLPFHSMIMTNWDVTQALSQMMPNIPKNPQLEAKIAAIRNSYHPAH